MRRAATAIGAAALLVAGGAAYGPERASAAPITTEQAQFLGSGTSTDDSLGYSVAISGDTAVVGMPLDDTNAGANIGSVYVFARSGTTWTEQARLVASDGDDGDEFGHSVAISGNTIVVGSHLDDTPSDEDRGSAYVFVRPFGSTVWTQQQHLFASDGQPFDQFGASVAISRDTVVVGAEFDDNAGGANAGSAYVFNRSGTTWTEAPKLLADDPSPGDRFGAAVAISVDTAVVGAPFDDHNSKTDAGSAYVYFRPIAGAFAPQAHLFPPVAETDDFDHFGASVAISGDTVVVGAPDDDTTGGASAGSARVFTRTGVTWTIAPGPPLAGINASTNDHFGFSVAVWGNTIVIGAYQDNTPAGADAGSIYVYKRSGTGWALKNQLFASDAAPSDQFGVSVAVSGDTAIAGADLNDTFAGADAGAAYVFTPSYIQDQWQPLGGRIIGRPDVAQLADGSLMYFATGTDQAVWMHRVDPDGNSLGWSTLGGVVKVTAPEPRTGVTSGGVGASNAIKVNPSPGTGRIDVFVRGADDAVWYRTFNAPTGEWSPWASLGGIATSEPSAMAFGDPDGASLRIEVFVRGRDNALWRQSFTPGGGWSGWFTLFGVLRSGPGAGGNPTAFRGTVAVRGADNAVWYRDYNAETQLFSAWTNGGGIINAEPEGEYLCTATLFGRGTDNAIWTHSTNPSTGFQSVGDPGGGARSGPGTHEMVFSELDASRDWIVSIRGSDDGLWARRHRWVPDEVHCLPGVGDDLNRKPPLAG